MTVALIVLAVLLVLLLLPFGAIVRYDEAGLLVFVKVWLLRFQVVPAPPKKKDKKGEKKEEKPKDSQEPPAPRKKDKEGEAKKGGKLELLRAALPLVKQALVGLKKRLTIRQLELHVVWAGSDPADVAVGYGYANAALGTLWAVLSENFKIKKHSLGASVSFEDAAPTVYLNAIVTLNLWKLLTLVLPLLVRFLRNYYRLKGEAKEAAPDNTTKKEA